MYYFAIQFMEKEMKAEEVAQFKKLPFFID